MNPNCCVKFFLMYPLYVFLSNVCVFVFYDFHPVSYIETYYVYKHDLLSKKSSDILNYDLPICTSILLSPVAFLPFFLCVNIFFVRLLSVILCCLCDTFDSYFHQTFVNHNWKTNHDILSIISSMLLCRTFVSYCVKLTCTIRNGLMLLIPSYNMYACQMMLCYIKSNYLGRHGNPITYKQHEEKNCGQSIKANVFLFSYVSTNVINKIP